MSTDSGLFHPTKEIKRFQDLKMVNVFQLTACNLVHSKFPWKLWFVCFLNNVVTFKLFCLEQNKLLIKQAQNTFPGTNYTRQLENYSTTNITSYTQHSAGFC